MGELWKRLLDSLSPQQLCLSCILITGLASVYGVNTFAKNTEVSEIREQQLSDAAFQYRVLQCKAWSEGKPQQAYARLLLEAMQKYQRKTGAVFPLADCRDL